MTYFHINNPTTTEETDVPTINMAEELATTTTSNTTIKKEATVKVTTPSTRPSATCMAPKKGTAGFCKLTTKHTSARCHLHRGDWHTTLAQSWVSKDSKTVNPYEEVAKNYREAMTLTQETFTEEIASLEPTIRILTANTTTTSGKIGEVTMDHTSVLMKLEESRGGVDTIMIVTYATDGQASLVKKAIQMIDGTKDKFQKILSDDKVGYLTVLDDEFKTTNRKPKTFEVGDDKYGSVIRHTNYHSTVMDADSIEVVEVPEALEAFFDGFNVGTNEFLHSMGYMGTRANIRVMHSAFIGKGDIIGGDVLKVPTQAGFKAIESWAGDISSLTEVEASVKIGKALDLFMKSEDENLYRFSDKKLVMFSPNLKRGKGTNLLIDGVVTVGINTPHHQGRSSRTNTQFNSRLGGLRNSPDMINNRMSVFEAAVARKVGVRMAQVMTGTSKMLGDNTESHFGSLRGMNHTLEVLQDTLGSSLGSLLLSDMASNGFRDSFDSQGRVNMPLWRSSSIAPAIALWMVGGTAGEIPVKENQVAFHPNVGWIISNATWWPACLAFGGGDGDDHASMGPRAVDENYSFSAHKDFSFARGNTMMVGQRYPSGSMLIDGELHSEFWCFYVLKNRHFDGLFGAEIHNYGLPTIDTSALPKTTLAAELPEEFHNTSEASTVEMTWVEHAEAVLDNSGLLGQTAKGQTALEVFRSRDPELFAEVVGSFTIPMSMEFVIDTTVKNLNPVELMFVKAQVARVKELLKSLFIAFADKYGKIDEEFLNYAMGKNNDLDVPTGAFWEGFALDTEIWNKHVQEGVQFIADWRNHYNKLRSKATMSSYGKRIVSMVLERKPSSKSWSWEEDRYVYDFIGAKIGEANLDEEMVMEMIRDQFRQKGNKQEGMYVSNALMHPLAVHFFIEHGQKATNAISLHVAEFIETLPLGYSELPMWQGFNWMLVRAGWLVVDEA